MVFPITGPNINRENKFRTFEHCSFSWAEDAQKRITFTSGGYGLAFDSSSVNKDNEINALIIKKVLSTL
jgi:hypothetical protein